MMEALSDNALKLYHEIKEYRQFWLEWPTMFQLSVYVERRFVGSVPDALDELQHKGWIKPVKRKSSIVETIRQKRAKEIFHRAKEVTP